MLNGLGNFASFIKQAREMRGRMEEIQETLSRLQVEGSAGGGMVTVEANGQQKILSCRIDPSLFESGDQEMLEDLLVAATNQALEKSAQLAKQEMGKLTEGLEMPGLGEALSKLGLGGGPATS